MLLSIKVKVAFRLGHRINDCRSPKPLKVVLAIPEETQAIIRRTYHLKGQRVRILRDLAPKDRRKLSDALTELRERRNNGGTHLVIQDLQVVRRRPHMRWLPMSAPPRVPQQA